jgi:hypothetical protein
MDNQKFKAFLFVILFILSINATSQIPQFYKAPFIQPGDSTNIMQLIKSGSFRSEKNVIAWFPKDSLSVERMDGILDTLSIGIAAAERLIKTPQTWQVHQKGMPYTFYFRLDSLVSRSSGSGFVSIPFWRIKQGKAPWLHEAIHEMLNTKNGNWNNDSITLEVAVKNTPLWLSEGLPEYISQTVSHKYKLPFFDVQSKSFLTNVDSICREDLKGKLADSVLAFIGKKGALIELFGKDRRLYAPTFYHCSCSFVKYLAERNGIDPLIESLAAYPREMEELEKRIHSSLEYLKKDWLIKINQK